MSLAASNLSPTPTTVTRPRARGWIHLYSATVAAVTAIVLVVLAAATVGAGAALATSIYGLTVIGLFSISATYHLHTWSSLRSRTWMKRADHSMIFLFIAGTYTPVAALALNPPSSTVVLTLIWIGAAGGVALKMLWPSAPRWLGVPIYIALGWVAIFVLPDLMRTSIAAAVLVVVGGMLYTVGAVFYASRRPNPWPATFGYHEFFHACVSVAALCHCVAIWLLLFR